MKYAIVEQGGKQYKVVEGEPVEVDRLSVNPGDKFDLERVLMLVDGEDISIGTPTVKGIKVKTTVESHFKGPKIIVFKYHPRKRYRQKSGHRQQYTRLVVDAIGKAAAAAKKAAKKDEDKVVKKEAAATPSPKGKKTTAKKAAAKKTAAKKSTAKKAAAKKTAAKKPAAKKSAAKKTSAKKTTAKKSTAKKTSAKKTSSAKKSNK